MARELERTVVALVHEIYGGQPIDGRELPEVMPPRERRTLDAVLQRTGEPPRILGVDEMQHFNGYRAATLRAYPDDVPTAFPREL